MIITSDELKVLLVTNNISVTPSRQKGNTFVRTFSLTPRTESKLERLCKRYRVNKSQMMRLLIEAVKE